MEENMELQTSIRNLDDSIRALRAAASKPSIEGTTYAEYLYVATREMENMRNSLTLAQTAFFDEPELEPYVRIGR